MNGTRSGTRLGLAVAILLAGCERAPEPGSAPGDRVGSEGRRAAGGGAEAPPIRFRNVESPTDFVGDEACVGCHEDAASAYRSRGMARSFHPWDRGTRVEGLPPEPLRHAASGFRYAVVEAGDGLVQEEFLVGPDGGRLHELRRRMDHVMGSGAVARTYFTEENGRLFQLPLTWYREGGWDFSPGYERNNARFGRLMPDRCLACHGGQPERIPLLEGKYAALRPGIGCERCHGPGALHVRERSASADPAGPTSDADETAAVTSDADQAAAAAVADTAYDDTIVDPARLPFERRIEVCEQCHVHTPVTVLREGRDAFDYRPSEPLADHAAFYKLAGSIDIVSHADRLRQSACFAATRSTARPLECATCHEPHAPRADPAARNRSERSERRKASANRPCASCHAPAALEARSPSRPPDVDHGRTADCVACHMPETAERSVPHGTFTDHWIRVVEGTAASGPERPASVAGEGPLEPYFERDRSGPEAAIYRAMAEIVYATRAPEPRLLSEAAEALDRALGEDTTRADAHFLLGLAYRQLGRSEEALRALERSVRVEPDQPERLHALAAAYRSAGRDPSAVAPLYERALELQPALAWIRADYADFLAAAGRRKVAEAEYRRALEERPSLDVAAFELGTLLAGMGRLDGAAQAFGEAVRLNPALAEALAPLLQVRVAGGRVRGARALGSPLASLPLRDRGPRPVRPVVAPGDGVPVVIFTNVPAGASVRILEPDGWPVRDLPPGGGETRAWDLRTETGAPVAGGLFQVVVDGDTSGAPEPERRFFLGIVRVEAP